MTAEQMFEDFDQFDHAQYEPEARERWGDTEAYRGIGTPDQIVQQDGLGNHQGPGGSKRNRVRRALGSRKGA